ncbi:ParB/RepB/Spo0J family partition protein [Methylobacterium marchantiae]|uniref:ParB/RepB/Spo0J family partition protein n=1 Tax=Methylobacterium marchantiae TaxID=600331 RepID=A0ABW3WWJ1_9HYPH|nr:Nucleoid occlusion protein [Methylobacterium marchantiae]
MKLDHIDLSDLKSCPLNVRKHGGKDVSDLVTSIRRLGVLQPVLVRKNCEGYEVVAGQRRLTACRQLAEEGVETISPIPCAVMEEDDDAAAIEASLAENIARLPMDEIDQYQAFAALIAQKRTVDDIASQFGVSERLVRQRLAIANLTPAILALYRKDEIGGETMRALTMATKSQQKAWLKLWRDPEGFAPQGRQLRQWLLGGEQIATSAALFPLAEYGGAIVSDLFGEDAYFADPNAFWTLQSKAIADRAEGYRARGWNEVVLLERGAFWSGYEHRKVSKKDGGKIFIAIARNGEISFHEGFLTEAELRRREAKTGKEADSAVPVTIRPELTKAAVNYVGLHRHAAVRTCLLKETGIALRLAVAHMIAGSALWQVRPEPQRADKPETAQSLSESRAEGVFAEERGAVLTLLGLDADSSVLTGHAESEIGSLFEILIRLEDADVMRVLGFVMSETLEAGTALIDTLGRTLGVRMEEWWQADDAFLSLIRDRQTLLSMLEEVGGTAVASAHTASPAKTLRSIVRQYATGEGRAKVEGWVPRQMAFPAGSYADRSHEAA